MISRKLNSLEDIQNYLAYTVKVMELSNRFQWPSVLKYDDEFRLLRATYGYPWSFDCNHLHTVLPEPIPKTPTPTRSTSRASGTSTQFAVTTSERRTICRSYNSPRVAPFPTAFTNTLVTDAFRGVGRAAKATQVIAMLIPSIPHCRERGPPPSDYP